MRVRRRHHRRPSNRPAVCARRPYTRLITIDEAFKFYDLGVEIGEHRGERMTDYDKGWADGWHEGVKDGYEEALRDLGGQP